MRVDFLQTFTTHWTPKHCFIWAAFGNLWYEEPWSQQTNGEIFRNELADHPTQKKHGVIHEVISELVSLARHCVKIGCYSILFHMCKHKEPSQRLMTAFPHLLLSAKTVITSCSLVAEPWRSSLWWTLPLSRWWSGPERAGRWSPPSPPRTSACCGCLCPSRTAPGRRPPHGNTAQVGGDPPFLSSPKPETRRKQTEKH